VIVVVATVQVHPGREAEYEYAVSQIMPEVRESNPGIVFYHAAKCREAPSTYRVIEAYADQAAMDAHVASTKLQESLSALYPLIADLDIKLHDAVA